MANQVITIDRKKYAVGLFWQPMVAGVQARNYAKTLSRSVDKKLNLFTEYRAMVGLGAKRTGHKVTMPSAATEVMESFAEFSSFLAAFHADHGFWIVAVRNGIIIYDNLFDTEDAAREEFTNLANIPDWASLFAPNAWGVPRAIERDLHDIVTGNVRALMRPISRFKADFISVALLVLFALGVAYFFRGPISQMLTPRTQVAQIDPKLAEEYKRQIEAKNRELDQQFDITKNLPTEPEPLEMPYDYLPDPMARAQICYQAIGLLMQPVAGWNQTDAECGETHANVTFKRSFGTLAGFYDVATTLMPGAFVQEITESEIMVRVKLPELIAVASIDERDAVTIVRDVNTLFQQVDTPVDTNIAIDVVSNDTETVELNIVEVAARSKLTPGEFIKIFKDMRGVYMTRCTWAATSRTWNYEVIIYAK